MEDNPVQYLTLIPSLIPTSLCLQGQTDCDYSILELSVGMVSSLCAHPHPTPTEAPETFSLSSVDLSGVEQGWEKEDKRMFPFCPHKIIFLFLAAMTVVQVCVWTIWDGESPSRQHWLGAECPLYRIFHPVSTCCNKTVASNRIYLLWSTLWTEFPWSILVTND